ncbi:MAG: DEAD/DEAH box helicase [Gammaproteobacteria bacterium]|nr:DEAD/DEAH box helicase [Gammaproteobacteria bacterium]
MDALVSGLLARWPERICAHVSEPATTGSYAPLPEDLSPALVAALASRGIHELYRHQKQAWDCVQARANPLIVTPTASGKSLCYHLPVVDAVLKSNASALYLFPTKALSQDQVTDLVELDASAGLGLRVNTFDGDTPTAARKAVREWANIVVSNPDMLHQGILPHHTKWIRFFEQLQFVVVDELHTYRGVFGAHVANVLRRLKRICQFYGRNPQFILCSATIANPKPFGEQLIGAPVEVIDKSGAPTGARHFVLCNPPVANHTLGLRQSPTKQAVAIATEAINAGLSTIVFARTRLTVEVLTKYLKDKFDPDPRKPQRIKAYRGGYLPTERRSVEALLRDSSIDGVVSTSALELGVDIGALDVCVLNGYPGSIAATRQRLGRAGRRNRPSLGVLVAGGGPLDQFVARHPEFIVESTPEHARIDPDQLLVLMDHVRCAAFELPFEHGETFGDETVEELLDYLVAENVLYKEGSTWHWIAESYPANAVSLRHIAEGNFVVVDCTDGQQNIIAEVDYSGAASTLYEGAIYLIQASPWQVESLDWTGRKAYVRKTHVDYYTDAIDYVKLRVLEAFDQTAQPLPHIGHGEVHVVRRVTGYKKIRYYSHENVGYGHVNLPDQEMHTSAVWWALDESTLLEAFTLKHHAIEGLMGAAYALHHVAALMTMCELSDLGRTVGSRDGRWHEDHADTPADAPVPRSAFDPTIFLYDAYPGGTGLAEALYALRADLLHYALRLIRECECRNGCPACVGPSLQEDDLGPRSNADGTACDPKSNAFTALTLIERMPIAHEPAAALEQA